MAGGGRFPPGRSRRSSSASGPGPSPRLPSEESLRRRELPVIVRVPPTRFCWTSGQSIRRSLPRSGTRWRPFWRKGRPGVMTAGDETAGGRECGVQPIGRTANPAGGESVSRSRRSKAASASTSILTGREIGLSRTQIQRAVVGGRVRVNGSPVRSGRKLKTEDEVGIILSDAEPSGVLPEAIPLTILYEDSSLPGHRQAGGWWSIGRRPFRRHPRQCADAPLPGPLGDRRRSASPESFTALTRIPPG